MTEPLVDLIEIVAEAMRHGDVKIETAVIFGANGQVGVYITSTDWDRPRRQPRRVVPQVILDDTYEALLSKIGAIMDAARAAALERS